MDLCGQLPKDTPVVLPVWCRYDFVRAGEEEEEGEARGQRAFAADSMENSSKNNYTAVILAPISARAPTTATDCW